MILQLFAKAIENQLPVSKVTNLIILPVSIRGMFCANINLHYV